MTRRPSLKLCGPVPWFLQYRNVLALVRVSSAASSSVRMFDLTHSISSSRFDSRLDYTTTRRRPGTPVCCSVSFMATDDARVPSGRPGGVTDEVEHTFRRGVRTWRELHGLTQTELAQRMEERGHRWHQATVYKVEDGRRPTRLAEAVALAEVLEVPLTHLIGPDAPERVARFELARATQRAKEARREVDRWTVELGQAEAERVALAARYNELAGFTSTVEAVTDDGVEQ